MAFFLPALLGLRIDVAGGGAGTTGAADGGASAATSGGGAGTAAGSSETAAGGAAAAASGAASVSSPQHLGTFIDDKGAFKPGWTKACGVPETLETKFTSPEALLKSYVAAERMIGNQNKVAVPNANSTPEERAAFFKAIGRPDKPEEYGVKMPDKLPDGKPFPKEIWSEERAGSFTKLAHELGLTKAQVDALAKFDLDAGLKAHSTMSAAQAALVAAANTELKKEWGAQYDTQLALAERAAKAVGLVGADNPELANNPAFIKAMARVGRMLGEDGAAGARGTSHVQSDPKQAISAIMNDKGHPYWKAQHPEHANAVKQMAALRALAHPEPNAA